MKNIVKLIQSETKRYLDKPAILDKNRKVTYAELFAAVEEVSAVLKSIKIKKGKRVALLCDDSIDYVILSLAVIKLSAVIVPVPFAASKQEIKTVLESMKVGFLIFEKGAYQSFKAKHLKINSCLDKEFFCLLYREEAAREIRFFSMNPAFIRFSSGTTGSNKGVIISHQAIIERTDAADKALRITRRDNIIWVLSMSFHFVVTILLFLRRGATIILAGNPFPVRLLAALKKHKPTFIYASPLHYNLLARLGSVLPEDLAKVRIAVSTAVELPLKIAKDFYAKFGFTLNQAYGIIEVGLPFINLSQDISKLGSVGRILPDYKIRLVNKDNNGAGEIYLKGKGFFSAYFWPWKSAPAVMKNGWFSTGDIGRIDDDGFLFILGRAKNVINFNGMKIFPAEVEAVLNQYPGIEESKVYAVTHPEYGNLPSADIVLRKSCKEIVDTQALRSFCYQHLAKYKVPKEFRCVEKLEKTLSGKLKREIIKSK
jgi:long-chain acyl-CoA synthetase